MISRSSDPRLSLNRRDLPRVAATLPASLALASTERWRTFEVTTRVEVVEPQGVTRVWVPSALAGSTPFQKTISNNVVANGAIVRHVRAQADRFSMVAAEFPAGVKPVLTLTSRISTANYAVDLSVPARAVGASRAELDYFRRPTKLLPTD